MAKVVEEVPTEKVVVEKDHVHDDVPRSNIGTVLVVLIVLIILLAIFWWRPWGGSSSGTNTNVTPSTSKTGY